MDFYRIDDCGCHKPCQIPSTNTCLSRNKNVSSTEKLNFYNLHNFTIILQIPTRRENCKGVGKISSQDCNCLHNFCSNVNASKVGDNITSNQPHDEFSMQTTQEDEEEVKEYLRKLIIVPKENYTIS